MGTSIDEIDDQLLALGYDRWAISNGNCGFYPPHGVMEKQAFSDVVNDLKEKYESNINELGEVELEIQYETTMKQLSQKSLLEKYKEKQRALWRRNQEIQERLYTLEKTKVVENLDTVQKQARALMVARVRLMFDKLLSSRQNLL